MTSEQLALDMKYETSEQQIVDMCDRLKRMLLDKNRRYGDSALSPVRIFSKAPADEQIRVRLDDKISRLSRGDDSLEDEDVVMDLIGYLVLLRIASQRNQ